MNQKDRPLVTVLMPAYNAAKYVEEAIDSILNQTFCDYELMIINDGSKDETFALVEQYTDARIICITNEQNLGLIRSLNRGLSLARGKYIARMDADDICLLDRLEKQVEFLGQHSDVGIVSSHLKAIDPSGKPLHDYDISRLRPTQPGVLGWSLLFYCCVAHSAMMARRTVFDQLVGYSEKFAHAEDYELLLRARTATKIANLPDVHLLYRKHPESVSHQFLAIQLENSFRAQWKAAEELLEQEIPKDVAQLLFDSQVCSTSEQFRTKANLLQTLYHAYITSTPLSGQEKRLIQQDLLTRLTIMVSIHVKIAPWDALRVWQKGLQAVAEKDLDLYLFLLSKMIHWLLPSWLLEKARKRD